jgi:hypothetical protein
MAVGGMPEAVKCWVDNNDLIACNNVHQSLITAYKQDFLKYAKKFQLKYVELLFSKIPFFIGKKFKYSNLSADYRKRELAPCLELLAKAGVIHKIFHSSGNGIPLGGEADPNKFKVIFLDIAITQTILGLDTKDWILNSGNQYINMGNITEAFVGQELMAYSQPNLEQTLYYWHKETRGSSAEVDYLIQKDAAVVPIEVKCGHGSSLKSLQIFLSKKTKTPYGVRLSTHNYSIFDKIHSYPLYAVAKILSNDNYL